MTAPPINAAIGYRSPPDHADTWSWNDGDFTYVPEEDFEGLVSFQYKIVQPHGWWEKRWKLDGNGNPYEGYDYQALESPVATVTIEVGKAVRADLTIEGLAEEDETTGHGRLVALNNRRQRQPGRGPP